MATSRSWQDLEDFSQLEELAAALEINDEVLTVSSDVIAPIGLLINAVFLFTVLRVKSMRTIINIYLSNLAVADSLILFCQFLNMQIPPNNINQIKAIICIRNTLLPASDFLVMTIAIERFNATYSPLKFKEKASKTRAAKISAGIWVSAIAVGVTMGFVPIAEVAFYYTFVGIVSVINLVALSVTLVLYISIVVKVHKQSALFPNTPRRSGKVLCMVIVNTAAFFAMSSLDVAGAVVVAVLASKEVSTQTVEFSKLGEKVVFLSMCTEIVRLINSSIDPLVYSATNADFRAAVVEAFSCLKVCSRLRCCPRRNPSRLSQPEGQIELRVLPQAENDQEHQAARPSSGKPPSQGQAQHPASQQSLDSCQEEQRSWQHSSNASMHSPQHVQVHVEVHAEPARDPGACRCSHQEQCF